MAKVVTKSKFNRIRIFVYVILSPNNLWASGSRSQEDIRRVNAEIRPDGHDLENSVDYSLKNLLNVRFMEAKH